VSCIVLSVLQNLAFIGTVMKDDDLELDSEWSGVSLFEALTRQLGGRSDGIKAPVIVPIIPHSFERSISRIFLQS
jgi:hypothetical protein